MEQKITPQEVSQSTFLARAILFIMIFTLFLPMISAWEWDNVGVYNETTRTMTIINFFGLGETIAKITLLSPYKVYAIAGEERLIAWSKIENFEEYDGRDVFGVIEVFDLKRNNRSLNKNFMYKKQHIEEIEYSYNKTTCEGKGNFYANGTEIIECLTELIEAIKYVEEWQAFNKNNLLMPGNITLGLFTEVKKRERADWVPTFYGVKINQWATWEASFNAGLVAYYQMQQTTGHEEDLQFADNNFTTFSGNVQRGVTGLIGNAYNFTGGSGDYVETTSIDEFNSTNGSISVWINWTDDGTENIVLGFYGPNDNLHINVDSITNVIKFTAGINAATKWRITLGLPPTGVWTHFAYVHNGTGVDFYLNGTKQSITYADSTDKTIWAGDVIDAGATLLVLGAHRYSGGIEENYLGLIDEVAIWNRTLSASEISDLYNGGAGITFQAFPVITHNAPDDNFFTSSSIVDFNCTASIIGGNTISNISLFTNQSGTLTVENFTSGLTGVVENTAWSHSLGGEGNFLWICQACDSGGDCEFASANRTFTIDSTSPIINITFPISPVRFHETGNNFTINWTIIDPTLDGCFYNYNFTTNITVVCSDNSTRFIVADSVNRNLIFYANDSAGNLNTAFFSWDYLAFKEDETFNKETLEGNTETFSINLTVSFAGIITNANLSYDGVEFIPITTVPTETNTILSSTITIPSVVSQENRSFFWKFDVDGVQVSSTINNQTVNDFSVDNCTSNTNKILNFSVVDEEFQTSLFADIEIAVSLLNVDRSVSVSNFSSLLNGTSVAVCFNIELLNQTLFVLDTVVKYSADGYATEYYNIVNFLLSNNTKAQNITLFDLNSNDSTEFRVTFTGDNFLPVAGALVFLDRQYISENTFKTVELPITDPNGQTILHLVRNDVVYNIRFLDFSGKVLGNFQEITAFCEDPLLQNCQISLSAISNISATFNYDELTGLAFPSAPTFNNNTNTISFNFIVPEGSVKTVTMNVTRNDVFGNRTICQNTLVSASGTLICPVDPAISDTTLSSSITVDGITILLSTIDIDTTTLGSIGYVVWFILTLVLIFGLGDNKNIVLISLVISYIGAVLLGLSKGAIIGFGAAGMWILIVTFLAIWRLNRDKVQ